MDERGIEGEAKALELEAEYQQGAHDSGNGVNKIIVLKKGE